MKRVFFKGEMIFEFDDNNSIQLIGKNTYLINLLIALYIKIFNGYRYSDLDIDAMNGYYPEITEDDAPLSKNDIYVIKLSNLNDLIEQLASKNNSILMRNILSFSGGLEVSNIIHKLEELLIELSVEIDNLLNSRIKLDTLLIQGYTDNVTYKKIIDSFFNFNFILRESGERIPSWLLNEGQSIDILIHLINLLIESGQRITFIIDRLDSDIEINNYYILVEKLFELSLENSNFNIWIIPSKKDGVFLDYRIFKNTYIINEEIFKLGDFETTYESICRNYPDNKLPSNKEVLSAILQYYPFHDNENYYTLNREVVIMSVFLELIGHDRYIKLINDNLTALEKNFLIQE